MGPETREWFTNVRGQKFDNVREIAYTKNGIMGNLGKPVAESNGIGMSSSSSSNDGVYIYQTHKNPNVAYRIYKEYAEHSFNGYGDDLLIQRLFERKEKIKKTKFPTGVVTLEGRIIGQEIPYYENSVTLLNYVITNSNINIIEIYKYVLEILKELQENGIIYLDVHAKNFVVDLSTLDINLIDFDSFYIKFDNQVMIKSQLEHYRNMINFLNNVSKIMNITGTFKTIGSYEEGFEQLKDMSKRLSKNIEFI